MNEIKEKEQKVVDLLAHLSLSFVQFQNSIDARLEDMEERILYLGKFHPAQNEKEEQGNPIFCPPKEMPHATNDQGKENNEVHAEDVWCEEG